MLVPTSTVAIEALGAGCDVIIPVFPDAMLMNPLADFDSYHHTVANPRIEVGDGEDRWRLILCGIEEGRGLSESIGILTRRFLCGQTFDRREPVIRNLLLFTVLHGFGRRAAAGTGERQTPWQSVS